MRIVMLLLCFFTTLPLLAAEEILPFADPKQQALFRELTHELRCPKCQNQNIADSNAVVAVDMRKKTYELVQQGQDKAQVIEYMKLRYGDFVHYQPPLQLSTIWLWLLPALLVLGMGVFVVRKNNQQQLLVNEDVSSELDAELQAMIDEATVKPNTGDKPA
ncbi:cytochrome c-type biogenesis protein CcmH [Rheinheimera riviphila]|uniref:Cytochrome c-type biogenesis protein n=1 Tax=Rheinheimera riviphila TaxID=1834037 RepID=A0A437R363_9GAMM|nr:cytochrome c-type biogenesis protein [Rheinheimera riviphila]RVU41226.1 cytochrome c-type biogenesis protein CcmH [Rheinheimera riviphila]